MLLYLASSLEIGDLLLSRHEKNTSFGTASMAEYEIKHAIKSRPRLIRSGDAAFFTQGSLLAKKDEIALTLALVTHRRLFGEIYAGIDPEYFNNMPRKSGVFVRPFVRTDRLIPNARRPGDIDLLIIPYESNYIVLHKVVAVEIKIIRALFANRVNLRMNLVFLKQVSFMN